MKDLLSIFFIAFTMLLPYIVNYYSTSNYKIIYIRNTNLKTPKIKNKNIIPKKNNINEKILFKTVKTEEKINPIKNEAIECLVALGMKKMEAKNKVNQMFLNKDYENLEYFLMDAYKI